MRHTVRQLPSKRFSSKSILQQSLKFPCYPLDFYTVVLYPIGSSTKGGDARLFNSHETGDEAERERVTQERLEMMKRAREAGYYDEEPSEGMPEVVADGSGPDDRTRPSPFVKNQDPPEHGERNPHPGGNSAVLPREAPAPKYYTSQPCANCDGYTRHISYGMGTPVWHCAVCCTCDWCMQTVERQAAAGLEAAESRLNDAQEQVERGRQALYEAVTETDDRMFFCTHCGAGWRGSTCGGHGTGRYCDLCGKRIGDEGFCTDCWKEAD